jgi:8-oxo-dGTP pyrophosphatase MutT (NUDIX family)
MTSVFRAIWSDAIRPMFRRPSILQLAALCHRTTSKGVEVLLVTSSNGRWILPKGWPIDGLSESEAAQQEAWEEGGVRANDVAADPIDILQTRKTYNNGLTVPCELQVYELSITEIANDYPEANKRDRIWVSPNLAAEMVEDPAIRTLLSKF